MSALPKIKVPSDGFPIAVERLTPATAVTLACAKCGASRPATQDEIGLCDGLPPCPECIGWMEWAYMEADMCKGCGSLGWWPEQLDHCCSRACMLQAEYAKQLRAAS